MKPIAVLRGIAGAAVGAAAGYVIFRWLVSQGFYALVLPGALLGLGYGRGAGQAPPAARGACASAAVCLGLFLEWNSFPFIADGSFGYFLAHVHELRPWTLIMLVLGAVCAYWLSGTRRPMGYPPHTARSDGERDD